MVLKVHGSPYSTCTQRVATALIEKGVPYEVVVVDFSTGEHKGAKFMAMQPFGKVPVLEDDGYFIFESRAICRYIAKKYAGQGTKLMPADDELKAYGMFEQACGLEISYFDVATSGIAFEKVFKGMKGLGAEDPAQVEKFAKSLDETLKVYDAILAKQAYLAGDELTLADLFHLPYGTVAKGLGQAATFDKYPNVKKWFDSLGARESWVKATAKP